MLAISDLDGRFLHNHCSDPKTDCGGLLGSTPAIQRYKVRPCIIKAPEIAVFCGEDLSGSPGDLLLDGGSLHSRWTDRESVCRRLLALMPAFQRYKVRLCRIKAQELAVFCRGGIRYQAGNTLLDGRLLHNRSTDLGSVHGRLLALMTATQRYKVCLYGIKTHESPNRSESGLLT